MLKEWKLFIFKYVLYISFISPCISACAFPHGFYLRNVFLQAHFGILGRYDLSCKTQGSMKSTLASKVLITSVCITIHKEFIRFLLASLVKEDMKLRFNCRLILNIYFCSISHSSSAMFCNVLQFLEPIFFLKKIHCHQDLILHC